MTANAIAYDLRFSSTPSCPVSAAMVTVEEIFLIKIDNGPKQCQGKASHVQWGPNT